MKVCFQNTIFVVSESGSDFDFLNAFIKYSDSLLYGYWPLSWDSPSEFMATSDAGHTSSPKHRQIPDTRLSCCTEN